MDTQDKSWNWNPMNASKKIPNVTNDALILHANFVENESREMAQEWCEISLMTDDDLSPSPRGHLEFKRSSESSDLYLNSNDNTGVRKLSETVVEIDENSAEDVSPVENKNGWGWKIVEDAAKSLPFVDKAKEKLEAEKNKIMTENEKYKKLVLVYKRKQKQMVENYDKLRISRDNEIQIMQTKLQLVEAELQQTKSELQNSTNGPCPQANQEMTTLKEKLTVKENELEDLMAKLQKEKDKRPITEPNNGLKIAIKDKERQLADAVKALEIAHARADQIRSRLVVSTANQQKQSTNLRNMAESLNKALEQSTKLKSDLNKERRFKKQTEIGLSKANKTIDELTESNTAINEDKKMLESERKKVRQSLKSGCEFICSPDGLSNVQLSEKLIEKKTNLEVEMVLDEILRDVEINSLTRKFDDQIENLQDQKLQLKNNLSIAQMEINNEKSNLKESERQNLDLKQRLQAAENSVQICENVIQMLKSEEAKLKQKFEQDTERNSVIISSLNFKILQAEKRISAVVKQNDLISSELKHIIERQSCDAESQTITTVREASSTCDILNENSVLETINQLHAQNKHLCSIIDDERSLLCEKDKEISYLMDSYNHVYSQCEIQKNRLDDFQHENWNLQQIILSLRNQIENFATNSKNESQNSQQVHTPQDNQSSFSYEPANSESAFSMPTELSNRGNADTPCHEYFAPVSSKNLDVLSSKTELQDNAPSESSVEIATSLPIKQQLVLLPEPVSVVQWTPAPSVRTNSSKSRRRRASSKPRKTVNQQLPEWRQEHPENHYNSKNGNDNSNSENNKQNIIRRIEGPMTEDEFSKMMTSSNIDVDHTRDDGYHSATMDSCADHFQEPWNITKRFQRFYGQMSPRTGNEDVTEQIEPKNISPKLPQEPVSNEQGLKTQENFFVEYKGIKFDAAHCNLAQIRQLAYDSGIIYQEGEMDKLFDFLATKSSELDSIPEWKEKHSLGRASDWLALKGSYGI